VSLILCTDNEGEYMSSEFKKYSLERGIRHEKTILLPHINHNDVVEMIKHNIM